MKRILFAAGGGVLIALLLATGAGAQYQPRDDDDETTTTTETPSTTIATTTSTTTNTVPGETTTTQESTTTTTAPPPPGIAVEVSNDTPAPGESIQLSADPLSAADDTAAFDETQPVTAGITAGDGETVVALVPTLTVAADGSVSVSVKVPENTPDGLYYVFVVGTDANGKERTIVAAIVVSSTAGAGGGATSGGAANRPARLMSQAEAATFVPEEVQALTQSMTATEEAEVVRAVLEEGATMSIEGDLLVLTRPDVEDDSTRPLLAAGAVGIIGAALVGLRRKPARVGQAA